MDGEVIMAEKYNVEHFKIVSLGPKSIDIFKKSKPDTVLQLQESNFLEAQLPEADLAKANLLGANFQLSNLKGANLKGANLLGADMLGSDLSGADLRGANLRGANLRETDLTGADLRGANLLVANLLETDLKGANLEGANLEGANFQKTNLTEANLKGASLQGANFIISNLHFANLEDANLSKAKLQGANLLDANLKNAILQEADLQGANLQNACLQNAKLMKINLESANLLVSDLREADLKMAFLKNANFEGANLQLVDLESACLQGTKLSKSHLLGANFKKANLENADLHGANLQLADFTAANLEKADMQNTSLLKAKFNYANLQNAKFSSKKVFLDFKYDITKMQLSQIIFVDEVHTAKKCMDGYISFNPLRFVVRFENETLWNQVALSNLTTAVYQSYIRFINLVVKDESVLEEAETMMEHTNVLPDNKFEIFLESIKTNPMEATFKALDLRNTNFENKMRGNPVLLDTFAYILKTYYVNAPTLRKALESSNKYEFDSFLPRMSIDDMKEKAAKSFLSKLINDEKSLGFVSFKNPDMEQNKVRLLSFALAPFERFANWAYLCNFGNLSISVFKK